MEAAVCAEGLQAGGEACLWFWKHIRKENIFGFVMLLKKGKYI